MPKVIVTCPDRAGVYSGYHSAAGFFGVGPTTVDLTDEQLAALKGEIERKESILTVEDAPAEVTDAQQARADTKADEDLEDVKASKGKGKR